MAAITGDEDYIASMLAYADWLRDRGEDDYAFAWEWAAKRGKYPVVHNHPEVGWLAYFGLPDRRRFHETKSLPRFLSDLCERHSKPRKWHKTHQAALEVCFRALAKALKDLRQTVAFHDPPNHVVGPKEPNGEVLP